jgi:hypothetical protein
MDDPYEIALVVILSLIGGMLFFGVLSFGAYNPQRFAGVGNIMATLFFALINFIPFGLITFGAIADLIGQELRYSIGSLIGMIAITLNFFLAKALGANVIPSGSEASDVLAWCTIPGMENLENTFLPMNIVSSSAIMTYYTIFASTVRDPGKNLSIWIGFAVIYLLQLISFYGGGCSKYYQSGFHWKLVSLLWGSLIGMFGWLTVSKAFPSYAPFLNTQMGGATQSNYGSSSKPPMSPGVGGAPPSGAKCSQDNSQDGDEFVCEAYKNGVLVTEEISK